MGRRKKIAEEAVTEFDKEEELSRLRAENEELRRKQETISMPNESLNDELRKIRRNGVVNTLGIPMQIINDHKNIYLYTSLNKRIGPLHPRNAEQAMIRFHEKGIQLFTTARTPEQVEAYKQTREYKESHKKHLAERERRRKASGKGSFERFTETIAKELSVAVSDLNKKPKDMPINV